MSLLSFLFHDPLCKEVCPFENTISCVCFFIFFQCFSVVFLCVFFRTFRLYHFIKDIPGGRIKSKQNPDLTDQQ
jgi:hypothetical protein